jgi:hypothetical protein
MASICARACSSVTAFERRILRQHADDHVWLAVEQDGAADDVRGAPELRLPQGMVQDRHMVLARLILAVGERPAEGRLHAIDVEKMHRYAGTRELHGLIDAGQRRRAVGARRHEVETGVLFFPIEIIERRDAVAPAARGRL